MSASDSRTALLTKFRAITAERLTGVTNVLLQLRERPDDQALFDHVKRELHTEKGEARMLGFVAVSRAAHIVESLLLAAREARFDGDCFALVLRAVDLIEALVEHDPSPSLSGIEDFVVAAAAALAAVGRELPVDTGKTAPARSAAAAAASKATPATPSKSDTPTPPAVKAQPVKAPAPVRAVETAVANGVESAGAAPPSAVAASTLEGAQLSALKRFQTLTRDDSVRVKLAALDRLTEYSSDLLLALGQADLDLGKLQAIHDDWRGAIRVLLEASAVFAATSSHSPERMADFVRLVRNSATQMGAMAARAVMLPQRFRDFVFEQKLGVESIENNIRDIRLVSLETLLSGVPRAVHDMAAELGKRAQAEVGGQDVGLDKHVLDQIAEPLLHLLRNAVDHGIEDAAVREAAGKGPVGTVRVSARQVAARVELSVFDDGAGIDPVAVIRRARGDRVAESTPEHERFELAVDCLFAPGFSTRSEVSEFSGRGVGLDVVKRRVESLGGTVTLRSELGRWTEVRLSVPVSVSVVQVLIARLDDNAFAIPVGYVDTVFVTDRSAVEQAGLGSAIRVNDDLVPLLHLRDAIRYVGTSSLAERFWVLVLQQQNGRLAFAVDSVSEVVRVLQRSVDAFLTGVELLSGTTVLEGGEVALMLNVPALFRGAHATAKPVLLDSRRTTAREVLLVDDSEIAREVVREVLVRHGYIVREAINGKEALREIEERRPRVVITDLEMPVLDGFELLRTLRASKATRELPVVVLSSRGTEADIRRAMNIGADGYLVKSRLEDAELLGTIERFATVDPRLA